ncbi:MAG: HAD family hydrolase [Candidatus Eremiobacteraeota bacterium]|nr:HAD family hydrolase [Candidatus Eremiobacteraeota bacterium]
MLRALGTGLASGAEELHERLVNRFTNNAAVLRQAIAVAQARHDDERLDDLLTKLALAEPTPATVAYARKLRPPSRPGQLTARIALLSSYTIDHLVPYVDLACRTLDVVPEMYVAPFNSWTRDIVDEASGLRRFEPDIVFLSVSIDDLMPQLTRVLSSDELEEAGKIALERVVDVARRFTAWGGGKPFVVHSFHSAFTAPLGVVDGREHRSRTQWLAQLNAGLADELRQLPACYLLDVNDAIAAYGGALGDNPKLRHLAAMRLPPTALAGVANAYARYVAPLKGLTRKCIVLDLDNTLWGGVVGEDGVRGIRLGSTSPGSEFVEFQEYLRGLTARGILLAVISKNNPDDALEAIRTHEAMVLREADFSAIRINWESKPDNMRSIAAELNIGLDAFVFVDDNPDERDRMRQLLPDVLTVDLPRDAALYRSVLERLPQLQTLAVTSDDRARVQNYTAARSRAAAQTNAASIDDYLKSLAIDVRIDVANAAQFARIAQLFAKTNQFNTTTKRYDAAEIARFANDPAFGLWALSSRDRFGDHGLVATALVRRQELVWRIDSLLMSCRVIGYGIETALLAYVAERARAEGATTLRGEFVATKKNAPAKELFAKHGFRPQGASGGADVWELSLAQTLEFPAWIERRRDDA